MVGQVVCDWSCSMLLIMFFVVVLSFVGQVLCVVCCWSGSPLLIRFTDVWSSVVNQCCCPLVLFGGQFVYL